MAQPRKEQIKDVQAKFSLLSPTASPFNGPLGLTPVGIFTGPSYGPFVASSVTGVLGGTVDPVPGFIVGLNQGPFLLGTGNFFAITAPQLNSGNPIDVILQASDVVLVNGALRVSTSNLANRINTVLAPYLAAASLSTVVASNQSGYLQLQSPDVGDRGSITITDRTANIISTIFGVPSPVTSVGVTGPRRGIITLSTDNTGGVTQVRKIDGEPCLSRQTRLVHVGGGKFTGDVSVGQVIYAKVNGSVGSVNVNFYSAGVKQASVVSNASTFNTLTNTDTLTTTITDASFGSPVVFTTNFATITGTSTIQNVVDLINNAWHASNGFWDSVAPGPAQGIIRIKKASFSFNGSPTFALTFNGGLSFGVTVDSSIYNQATLAAAIFSSIPLGVHGNAIVESVTGDVLIYSTDATGPNSTVTISAGANNDMSALDEMGIAPGTRSGSYIAFLYGNDEIRLINPSRNLGSSITLASTLTTMQKLGISQSLTSVTVSAAVGEESIVPGTQVEVLIPEAMEFGEIPAGYDRTIEAFNSVSFPSVVDQTLGIQNDGALVAIGPDGKIPSDLFSRQYDSLALETITLGAQSVNATGDTRARLVLPHDGTSSIPAYTLVSILPDASGNISYPVRIYADRTGGLFQTSNAYWNPTSSLWNQDNTSFASTAVATTNGTVTSKTIGSSNPTWLDSAWLTKSSVGVNTPGGSGAAIEVGFAATATSTTPMIAYGVVESSLTLLTQTKSSVSSTPEDRWYHKGNPGERIYTNNAVFNGTVFSADNTGRAAYFEDIGVSTGSGGGQILKYIKYTTTGTWGTGVGVGQWDDHLEYTTWSTLGGINQVFGGCHTLGDTLKASESQRQTARITVQHQLLTGQPSYVNDRTHVMQMNRPSGSGSSSNYHIYYGHGFNYNGTGAVSGTFYLTDDVYIESMNCYWTGTKWAAEGTASLYYNNFFMTLKSGESVYTLVRKAGGGSSVANWNDGDWIVANITNESGIQILFDGDNPSNIITNPTSGLYPLPNLLHKNNIVKAWGNMSYNSTLSSFDVQGGYGWIGCDSTGVLTLSVPYTNPHACSFIIQYVGSPGSRGVYGFANGSPNIKIKTTNITTGTDASPQFNGGDAFQWMFCANQ